MPIEITWSYIFWAIIIVCFLNSVKTLYKELKIRKAINSSIQVPPPLDPDRCLVTWRRIDGYGLDHEHSCVVPWTPHNGNHVCDCGEHIANSIIGEIHESR